MDKNKNDALVGFTDAPIDVLSEKGGGWDLALDGGEKSTIENIQRIFKVSQQNGCAAFISPRRGEIRFGP